MTTRKAKKGQGQLSWNRETQNKMSSSEDAIEAATAWKERGNAYYSKREFERSANAYQSGIDELQEKDSALAMALRANLAMVFLKLEKYHQADDECTQLLQIDPQNTKGMYVCMYVFPFVRSFVRSSRIC